MGVCSIDIRGEILLVLVFPFTNVVAAVSFGKLVIRKKCTREQVKVI